MEHLKYWESWKTVGLCGNALGVERDETECVCI